MFVNRLLLFLHLQQVRMADDFDVEAMLEAPYKKVGWWTTGSCRISIFL